jgi:hypothetical protein
VREVAPVSWRRWGARPISPAAASEARLDGTRWPFIALCCFLGSQAYTIPILPVGPWALWPRLSDFAAALLIVTTLLSRRHLVPPSPDHRRILGRGAVLYWFCALSYAVYLFTIGGEQTAGVLNGAFQLYALAWFFGVFVAASYLPLSPARLAVLRRVVDVALVIVVSGVILTGLDLVSLPSIAPHLPRGPEEAGPWYRYGVELAEVGENRGGWGTIGYNHAYVAAQILMLLCLRLNLETRPSSMYGSLILAVALLAVFMTHSRAGLAGALLFAAIYWVRNPRQALITLYVALALGLAGLVLLQPWRVAETLLQPTLVSTIERQETLADPTDPENLSGRLEIWQQRIARLDAQPLQWLSGAGFGAALDDGGSNAHMLYLHIVSELGALGLALYLSLFASIFGALRRLDVAGRPLLWGTVVLLFASLTQETFYPVPSQGYFLGFYLCAVAIALRRHWGKHGPAPLPARR